MNNFTFQSPTQFVFGDTSQTLCGSWLENQGYKKVLIVYGQGHAVASGLVKTVTDSLDAADIDYIELGGVRPNPEIGLVRQGVTLAKDHGVDFILGIGGGSVADCSKAIACGALYSGDPWDLLRRPNPIRTHKALPTGLVLTIPAAGSEASNSAVISNDELGLKCSLGGDHIRPKVAWMNPCLTLSLPAWQTAAGITDMCAHIFERFFSSTENVAVTDGIALSLLSSIRSEAIKVMRDPENYDGRANIMWLGMLAHNGIAGCGRDEDWTSHALEHELSAMKPEVTHGAGLAVIMPAWMRYVAKANPYRFRRLGHEVFGLVPTDDVLADAYTTIDVIQQFFCSLGMPKYMDDFGFVPEDIDLMVENLALTRGKKFGSFMELTCEDAKKIYLSAFKH